MANLPLFSEFDYYSELERKDIIDIIKQLIVSKDDFNKQLEILKISIQHQEQLEKPDDILIKLLKEGLGKQNISQLIQKLKDSINQLKYRGAGKPYNVFKGFDIENLSPFEPKGTMKFDQPVCVTEKVDGTQIQLGLKKYIPELNDENVFQLRSHSGGSIVNKKTHITLNDLKPYTIPGHTTIRKHEFQGGNLTDNFMPLIPQLWQLMDKYNLEEAWFYFELTFKVGSKTPKGVPYPDDKMNSCYLFCMTYNMYDDLGIPSHVVKLSVNPTTINVFQEFKIPTVDILYTSPKFSVSDFEVIMKLIHDNLQIEGLVFCQSNSYLKLITHYHTEIVSKYNIEDGFKKYAELQNIYHHYISIRQPKKDRKDTKQTKINYDFILEEFEKELSHNDWTELFTQFYGIPAKENDKVYTFVSNCDLTGKIMTSVQESEKLKKLSKSQRRTIIKFIKNQMITQKKTIKDKFNISSSTTTTDDVVVS